MGSETHPALVLLHGVTSSGRAWDHLVPALARRHEVFTPTTLGHRGGRSVRARTTMTDLVDAAERQLDDAGLDRPHIVGHSLGGYLGIELARRGRAQTLTAISPAGFWSAGDGTPQLVMRGVRRSARLASSADRLRSASTMVRWWAIELRRFSTVIAATRMRFHGPSAREALSDVTSATNTSLRVASVMARWKAPSHCAQLSSFAASAVRRI